jgi:hypothetical protein
MSARNCPETGSLQLSLVPDIDLDAVVVELDNEVDRLRDLIRETAGCLRRTLAGHGGYCMCDAHVLLRRLEDEL